MTSAETTSLAISQILRIAATALLYFVLASVAIGQTDIPVRTDRTDFLYQGE